MQAVRSTERGLEVVDVPDPVPDHESILLDVASASICGSDLHLLAFGPMPVTLGHEFAGSLPDGRAVAVNPNVPCGTCDQCIAGTGHRCRTGAQRILGIASDGGMARSVAVHTDALVMLPTEVPVGDACLVEPLGVATHGVRLAELTSGHRAAVVGAGAIGLAAVAAARTVVDEVGLVARHAPQHVAGERLGARSTHGEYDVVFECAGTESALAQAADLCRPGGRILFLSTHWSPVPIPGIPASMKELDFRWSFTYGSHDHGHDLDDAVRLLATNPEIAATLISHRYPLADAAEAFRVAADREAGAIKVVLEP